VTAAALISGAPGRRLAAGEIPEGMSADETGVPAGPARIGDGSLLTTSWSALLEEVDMSS